MQTKYIFILSVLAIVFAMLVGCVKDPEYSNELLNRTESVIELQSGIADREIAMESEDWALTYVRFVGNRGDIYANDYKPLALDSVGMVKAGNWLSVEKKKDKDAVLLLSLDENFSEEPRRLRLGVRDGQSMREILVTQRRGSGYVLKEKIITEEEATTFEHNDILRRRTLANANDHPINIGYYIRDLLRDTRFTSEFELKDPAHFGWFPEPDSMIRMLPVTYEGKVIWDEPVKFQSRITYFPYQQDNPTVVMREIPANSELIMQSQVRMRYRICNFTFVVQHVDTKFETRIQGVWKQRIPLTYTINEWVN